MSDFLKPIFLECCKFDKHDRFGGFLKVLGGVKIQKCRIFDGASFGLGSTDPLDQRIGSEDQDRIKGSEDQDRISFGQ